MDNTKLTRRGFLAAAATATAGILAAGCARATPLHVQETATPQSEFRVTEMAEEGVTAQKQTAVSTVATATLMAAIAARSKYEMDTIETSLGALTITFLGHGTLMLTINGRTIHIDPYSKVADYSELPKAHVVLITHDHSDHLDLGALAAVRTQDTIVLLNAASASRVNGGVVMRHGDVRDMDWVAVEAVPAYNIMHKRDNGQPYHPRGDGNGYVLTFGDKRVYVAGDTENTPEMKALAGIDCAFLPMNLPYTMTPEMVADAARAFRPKILYPYHFGNTDTNKLVELLKGEEDIEVRIRKME